MKLLILKIAKIFIAVLIPTLILYGLIFLNIIPFPNNQGLIYLIYDLLILVAYSGVGLIIFYLIKGFLKEDIDALKRTIKSIYKSIRRRFKSI